MDRREDRREERIERRVKREGQGQWRTADTVTDSAVSSLTL